MAGNLTCTYGFSHSIASSSITIDVDIINPVDRFSVELDGQPYAFTASDIVVTPLPLSALGTETIEAQGGAVQNAASTSASSGTVRLGAAAPARISTLKLNMDSSGGGGPTRVCIDDAAAVVPPTQAATPVPVTSTWGLVALGSLMGLAGIAAFARRRKQ